MSSASGASTTTPLDLDALYTEQWHPMVRLALLLADDLASAEDVVQNAFLALYRRPPRNADAAISYLRTAVLNNARSLVRRRVVARKHLRELVPRDVESADHTLIVAAEYEELVGALQRLPRRQREVLVLRYWSGLSEAEIARALGVSTGTVKSTASRGLDALETMLGGLR